MPEKSELLEKMKQIPLFQGLDEGVLRALSMGVTERTCPRDEHVFEEGEPGDAMYFILSGEAAVLKTVDREKNDYKSLGIIAEGEFFGEMALFDNQPRSATIMARTDLDLLRISRHDLMELPDMDAKTATDVLSGMIVVLSKRLRESGREQVAVYETGKVIASCRNISELIEEVFSIVMRAVPAADSGILALYNKFTEEFEIKKSTGFKAEELGDLGLSGSEPLLRILRKSRIFHEGNPSEEELFKDGRFSDAKALIAYPLLSGDNFLGFLALFSHSRERAFTSAQKNLLIGISSQVAPALENASFRKEEDDRMRLRRIRV
ncbi:MAG: cyclic nucleotide-binding domain-containing protein [bacterium]